MTKGFLILLVLLLPNSKIFAHRLNEYLQATTINLSSGKIFIELRLTPGTDILPIVLKSIDLDNDNVISRTEQAAYLNRVKHDLSLTLDGQVDTLYVISFSFPAIADMKKGVGDIIIDYEAMADQRLSTHQLKITNSHYRTIGVYLVNCLLPADSNIYVLDQTRSTDQSVYQLRYTTSYVHGASLNRQNVLTRTTDWAVTKTYFFHGIRHILTGYDHLLFLCALVLGAAGLWDLIKIVTAFTIAHSLTLTLATFGLAHLPEQIVEPIIAASIIFVAVQNIRKPQQAGSYTRLAIAFFFGLFHGLGFAGGLLDLMHAMPTNLIVFALLGFSLGVETGNQLVLLPLFIGLQQLKRILNKREKPQLMQSFKRYASGAVAALGIGYLIFDISTGIS